MLALKLASLMVLKRHRDASITAWRAHCLAPPELPPDTKALPASAFAFGAQFPQQTSLQTAAGAVAGMPALCGTKPADETALDTA